MQEIESRRKLTPADGAHIFYTAIFLTAASIIKSRYSTNCTSDNVDLATFVDFLFYGLLFWAAFLLISLFIPRYKNENLRIFFNLFDIVYWLYHLALLIFTCTQFYNKGSKTCAPQTYFLAQLYIYITGFALGMIVFGYGAWALRRFTKRSHGAGPLISEIEI